LISRFFIDRPIFAAVLSIVITLAGGIALFTLPIALYPPISPPTVQVNCTFPGASSQVVAETVATPIEQQVNGVENMLYMSSQCTNDGAYNLTVTFKHGVDLNVAQVLVQNRVSLAVPLLPDVIKQTGVDVRKQSPDILLAVALTSPIIKGETKSRYDQFYLSNYALMNMRDILSRMPGVSEVRMLGQRDISMRIWLDPDQLATRSMTVGDVVRAVRAQNAQVATGQIGQPPAPSGQPFQLTLSTLGRLNEVEQFENMIVKVGTDGRMVRMRDIARIESGAKNSEITSEINGQPAVNMAIFQLPDANALDTADAIKARVAELALDFPQGVAWEIRYDTTPFIRESIAEVFKTLRDAVILVAVVVLLFLQNWRSALIPLVAVPVAIIGTFAVMAALGFSLNNLTLFGLVLAIGIVVDDAIVVVEAVEHHVEHGMAPRDATIRAMDEVSGPVIAIGLVLTAVFVPCAFISGIVGQFFRQFALTIATSTVISAFNSLTLSPALAAMLIRPKGVGRQVALPALGYVAAGAFFAYLELTPLVAQRVSGPAWLAPTLAALAGGLVAWPLGYLVDRLLVWIFAAFNAGFRLATRGYIRVVGLMIRTSLIVLIIYGGLLYLTYGRFAGTPKGFIPSQDMGYLMVNVQLPDSVAAERTIEIVNRAGKIAKGIPGVKHTFTVAGQSLLLSAGGSNYGTMFVILDDFENRRTADKAGMAILGKLKGAYQKKLPEGIFTVLPPPPIRGVGRAGGFKLMLEDRGDNGPSMLQQQAENLVEQAGKDKRFVNLVSVFRANVPQFYADVNRSEVISKGVRLSDVFDTMRVYLGSLYVNDFNLYGRTWQVILQADLKYRNRIETVRGLKTRNNAGTMIPLGTLAEFKAINAPQIATRYNMRPAAPIQGAAAPGISSGDSIKLLEQIAEKALPPSMAFEWTELAYLEIQAGNTAIIVFGFAVAMVFLVLAAQYESWSLPLAIILVVPMCLLSAIIGVNIAGEDINIFTQIGFVVLVGLASKNAILIVEFAKQRREAGETRRQAALDACSLRLRPIIMTSMAFILGVLPLLTGHGAGSEMRRTLGITVFSGMLGVTIFGIFLTPIFFVVIDWLGETRLFNNRVIRLISGVPLRVWSLRFIRRPIRRLARPSGVPKAQPELVPASLDSPDSDPELATTVAASSGHNYDAELVDQK